MGPSEKGDNGSETVTYVWAAIPRVVRTGVRSVDHVRGHVERVDGELDEGGNGERRGDGVWCRRRKDSRLGVTGGAGARAGDAGLGSAVVSTVEVQSRACVMRSVTRCAECSGDDDEARVESEARCVRSHAVTVEPVWFSLGRYEW